MKKEKKKMIKKIQINNFQSHKETELEFHKGVNIIYGDSDSGKTSIIRALNWLINNSPSGDSFRSKWGGDTVIKLQEDNNIISRIKTKKENKYILNKNELKAVGTDVPDEIKQILNFSDINIQQQIESSFLLSNSSGEVARYLNQIVDLDKIDIALSEIEKKKKDNNKKLLYTQNELDKLNIELKEFDYLDDLEIDLKKIEKKQKIFTTLKTEKENMNGFITQIDSIKDKLKKYKNIDKKQDAIKKALLTIGKIESKQKEQDDISSIIISIQNNEIKKTEIDKKIKQEEKLDIIFNTINNIQIKAEEQKLLEEILTTEKKIQIFKKGIMKKEKEFEDMFPEQCPLCGK